ncbi:MAG: lipase maturation factor family protein [Deltaproteobacteria bacterium]|nr:lipase maturation factor family protein [Deltaproteobacteria bacterium]
MNTRLQQLRALSRRALGATSGPRIAALFQRLLGLCFLVAFASLAAQIDVLIGSRGLLPVAPWLDEVGRLDWTQLPTWLWLGRSDVALHIGVAAGLVVSALATLGILPRLMFALALPLYLGFVVGARSFLSFQWDNLLMESALLALLLPRDRRAPLIHLLFRLLLFKLYFESGIAKLESHLLDWHDGSAMTAYYETAPLPTWVAWHMHQLPRAWHHVESWFALGLELFGSFLILGPRALRLLAFVLFSLFQVVDILTANYGFFCYLSLALHVFLLSDADLHRARSWRRRGATLPEALAPPLSRALARLRRARRRLRARRRALWLAALRTLRSWRFRPALGALAALAVGGVWLVVSLSEGMADLARPPELCKRLAPMECVPRPAWGQRLIDATSGLTAAVAPFRLINTYHLFGHITRERVEPEFQTFDGERWTAHDLHYKPGDPGRPPPFVAPHQPRVDFNLWFYGLSFRRGTDAWVATLLERLCDDPDAVAPLFVDPLPSAPQAVRIAFWQYHYTTPEVRARTGDWWTRTPVGALRPLKCQPGGGGAY